MDQTKIRSGERGGNGRAISSRRRTSGTLTSASSCSSTAARDSFFPRPHRLLTVDRGQPSVGHYRKCYMPVPAMEIAHLIFVQPAISLAFPQTLLDGPACRGYPCNLIQRRAPGRVGIVVGDLLRIVYR